MDILAFAKNIEEQGIEFYSKLSRESPIEMLKGVFDTLADEERKHFELFSSLEKNVSVPTLKDSTVLGKAKDVFAAISTSFRMPEANYDYEAAYAKALELERESIRVYEDARSKVKDPSQQAVLEFITGQERAHARLLEKMIDFVRQPKIWLENAEWHHLDAY